MLPKISINDELLKLVKEKSVAVVGPAPYLLEHQKGKEIDKHDIIVRLNDFIPLKKNRKHYGTRTDIMFCNFGTPWMRGIAAKLEKEDADEHFKKIKLVVVSAVKSDHSEVDFLNFDEDKITKVVENFQKINKYNIPFYWIGIKDYKILYEKIGTEFNTGVASLSILLQYPVKKLSLYGFSFYKGGNTYKDLYCDGHMDEEDQRGNSFGFHSGHGYDSNQKQFNFLLELFKNYNIELDEQEKGYLNCL